MRTALRFLGLALFGIGITTAGLVANPFRALSLLAVILGAFLYWVVEGEPRCQRPGVPCGRCRPRPL